MAAVLGVPSLVVPAVLDLQRRAPDYAALRFGGLKIENVVPVDKAARPGRRRRCASRGPAAPLNQYGLARAPDRRPNRRPLGLFPDEMLTL